MKDAISIERVLLLHPKIRQSVTDFITEIETDLNITIRISQGMRTFAEQTAIYAQGRTAPGKIVTMSPAGSSYHNYGLAVDIVVLNDDGTINWDFQYSKINYLALKYGFTWGGSFPKVDEDHYENKYGYNWRDLLHLYTTGKFIAGTQFVDI